MKDPGNTAEALLDLPYAPEAEAYLDELERSGQFRIGIEAEQDDESAPEPGSEYAFGRGCGHLSVQDWWTSGSIALRIKGGLRTDDITISRVNDSLVFRTQDGLDRITFDSYLGLIPDASTLRVVFADGTVWAGEQLVSRISSWLKEAPPPTN
jgi:hypothetical protein